MKGQHLCIATPSALATSTCSKRRSTRTPGFYTDADGNLVRCLISECFEERSQPANGKASGRVISVTQAGDIASVLLGWDRPDDAANSYVDLHNLIRLDGVWKITKMTATHISRAAGA